jgi:hypothetical protein
LEPADMEFDNFRTLGGICALVDRKRVGTPAGRAGK